MNIRSLIKLTKAKIAATSERAYDNPYEWRLEIWHGPDEMPYHEVATFTKEELSFLIANMEVLLKELRNAENY